MKKKNSCIDPRCFVLTGPLNDKFLYGVADDLGNVYHRLGVQLGIPTAVIERIENDANRTVRRTFEILVLWRDGARVRADTVAMKEELCDALEDINLAIVADRVRRGEWIEDERQRRRLSRRSVRRSECTVMGDDLVQISSCLERVRAGVNPAQ